LAETIADICTFQLYVFGLEELFAKVTEAAKREHAAHEAIKNIGFRKKPKSTCKLGSNSKQKREWSVFVKKRQRIIERHKTAHDQYVVLKEKYDNLKLEFDNFLINLIGVPEEFRKNVSVSVCKLENCVNVIFGLPNTTLKEEHGHYAIYISGFVKYRREFGAPRGPQNHLYFEKRPELSLVK